MFLKFTAIFEKLENNVAMWMTFPNFFLQKERLQCCQQDEWGHAAWEYFFYRKVGFQEKQILLNLKYLKYYDKTKQLLSLFGFARKVNGPGTPRPLSRPKVSLANSLAANGLPDSTDNKDVNTEQEDEDKDSRYLWRCIILAFFVFSRKASFFLSSFFTQRGLGVRRFPRKLSEEQTPRHRGRHGGRTTGGEET